ncbi:13979_t:CDS:2 [Dentiscutata erythropus]|uniref:13979_t:CDS:1 n=1 Tax=Dentiscutata erythropus TaxID=1348616 RepID=A0A9N9CUR1_9GLOM|nr:13979_t:CDS:2 [Dentiscutata erythropus]
MSSIFIALCFIKTISASEKCIHGNAIYRTNNNEPEFRELTYKGFITQDSLIADLEKNSIALMIGRYVFEDAEYLTLIQTVPISTSTDDVEITPDDLPYTSPLLLFSAPVVPNSHFSNNEFGRESLMLSKKLYNGVTGHKNIESEVIVSYTNQNGRYNALKDNLKKTVLSVIGSLKIGAKKMLHIIATDIEWNYAGNEQTSDNSNKGKAKAQNDLNNHLESIEEKYTKLNSPSKKRQRTNLPTPLPSKTQKTDPQNEPQNNTSKPPNNKSLNDNFLQAVSQIKNTGTGLQNNIINNNRPSNP